MRATLLCLSVLFVVPRVDAAPAPAPGREAKQKLETFRKQLMRVLDSWEQDEKNIPWLSDGWTCKSDLRVLRRVGPDRVKAVVLFKTLDRNGQRVRGDVLLTISFAYQDGCWTTDQFEAVTRDSALPTLHATFAFLTLAIDEEAEKP